MYIKASELRNLDVINVIDGRHLGNVCDVDVDSETGELRFLILEPPGSRFRFFFRPDDLEIPWESVEIVGVDVILVSIEPERTSKHRTWLR